MTRVIALAWAGACAYTLYMAAAFYFVGESLIGACVALAPFIAWTFWMVRRSRPFDRP